MRSEEITRVVSEAESDDLPPADRTRPDETKPKLNRGAELGRYVVLDHIGSN